MARLSIDLPEHLPFRTELSLHVSHMNPGGHLDKYGCDIYWQAFERLSGREVASGKNGFVFLQAGTRKVSPIPEAFVARCKAIEQQAN